MKKIKVEEIDWISRLPDSILNYIFSFLPFKEAVQTCVLSKRWEELWLSHPVLEFDRSLFDGGLRDPLRSNNYNMETNKEYRWRAKELFSALVRNLRKRRKGKETLFPLKKLALEMDFFNDFQLKSLLDRCISYAVGCNVKELKLIFNCSRVYAGDYMMKNLVDGCPLIETLSFSACSGFKSVDVSGLSKLNELDHMTSVQGFCRDLISLSLSDIPNGWISSAIYKCSISSLEISSQSLKTLMILGCSALVGLRINTPNLHIFEYRGGIVFFSIDVLALSKFSLHLCCPRVESRWYLHEYGFFEPTQWYIKYVEFLAKLNDFSDRVAMPTIEVMKDAIVPPVNEKLALACTSYKNVSIRYGVLDESTFKSSTSILFQLSFSYKKEEKLLVAANLSDFLLAAL
ncbi:hypothetical protein EZV62_003622 [Acer yangbiense]|uniref:F-box domain-containing protein n=1 Tax=Acer yangbiense TaxID=1000413 RepID=A0A5C7IH93_9ROSI|nr:hypothetical protein EZV62_003622 [Acer yangbiense]